MPSQIARHCSLAADQPQPRLALRPATGAARAGVCRLLGPHCQCLFTLGPHGRGWHCWPPPPLLKPPPQRAASHCLVAAHADRSPQHRHRCSAPPTHRCTPPVSLVLPCGRCPCRSWHRAALRLAASTNASRLPCRCRLLADGRSRTRPALRLVATDARLRLVASPCHVSLLRLTPLPCGRPAATVPAPPAYQVP